MGSLEPRVDKMTSTERRELLKSVWHTLSGYRTLQCGQNHERVTGVANIELGGHTDHPGWRIELKGLCSKETRNSTVGCSHNNVLANYTRLVTLLIKEGIIAEGRLPMAEITRVIVEIYLMDHEKGRLEKRYAVVKEIRDPAANELSLALLALRDHHKGLIDRLGVLHQQVLGELQVLVLRYSERSD